MWEKIFTFTKLPSKKKSHLLLLVEGSRYAYVRHKSLFLSWDIMRRKHVWILSHVENFVLKFPLDILRHRANYSEILLLSLRNREGNSW